MRVHVFPASVDFHMPAPGETFPRTVSSPDGYHHTADDTIDKISPQSLQISADIFLELIRLINAR